MFVVYHLVFTTMLPLVYLGEFVTILEAYMQCHTFYIWVAVKNGRIDLMLHL